MRRVALLTQQRAQELFDYSVVTGKLYTRVARNRWGTTPAGSEIACPRLFFPNGRPRYNMMVVDGEHWLQHRLIWFLVTGTLPDNIDHENRDICCNAWHNLRVASVSENGWNRTKQSNNTSGHKGVFWDKNRSKWIAQIRANGIVWYLGRFTTMEAAKAAYDNKATELHKEFARNDEGQLGKPKSFG